MNNFWEFEMTKAFAEVARVYNRDNILQLNGFLETFHKETYAARNDATIYDFRRKHTYVHLASAIETRDQVAITGIEAILSWSWLHC
jgi:hypothetical protein